MCSCLSVAYYQPYFNVDTLDIQARLLRAILPFRKDPTFGEIIEQDSVDAYGPLWIAATFVFITACCSNAAAWIDFTLGHTSAYAYDLGRVATALTMTLVFVLGFPGTLWVIGKSVGVQLPLGTLLCLYGYSVLVYLPATVRCQGGIFVWLFPTCTGIWAEYSKFILTHNKCSNIRCCVSFPRMPWTGSSYYWPCPGRCIFYSRMYGPSWFPRRRKKNYFRSLRLSGTSLYPSERRSWMRH